MSKIKNSILGYIIGDAIGLPNDGKTRKELIENLENGKIKEANETSGNTAITFQTMEAIIKSHKINEKEILKKISEKIYQKDIKVNQTVKNSIKKWNEEEKNYASETSEDCSAIIRILPIALYTFYDDLGEEELLKIINKVCHITSLNEVNVMGCYIYIKYIHLLLSGYSKKEAYEKLKNLNYFKFTENTRRKYKKLLKTDIYKLDLDYLKEEDTIVNTLEEVIWVILNTNTFTKAIIGATNLGKNTAELGALTGSLAGIIYSDELNIDKIKNKASLLKQSIKFEEEISLNILKFDTIIENKYGIIKGGKDTLIIKTSSKETLSGYQNKYIKVAKNVNFTHNLTVIVINNPDENINTSLENLKKYIKGEVYFLGHASGALSIIQEEINKEIKKILLVNLPLMINLHKTKEGLKKYQNKITLVYGTRDQSVNYLPLLQNCDNIKIVQIEGQDHNFNLGNDFTTLPEKYLFE